MLEVNQKIELIEVVPIEEPRFEHPELIYNCPYCPAEIRDLMWHSPEPEEVEWDENDEAFLRQMCTRCGKCFYIHVRRIPGEVYHKKQATTDKWVKEKS